MNNIAHFDGLQPHEIFNILIGVIQAQSLVHIETLLNDLMIDELEALLDYINEDLEDGDRDKRNGYYTRDLNTRLGKLTLRIPRDRLALFKTTMFKKYQRTTEDIDSLMMSLYRNNMSESEIVDHLEQMYGLTLSRETIAKRVRLCIGDAIDFRTRRIPECVIVFMDATYAPIKRDGICGKSVEKEAIEVCLGITKDGRKEVLGYYYVPNEGASSWEEVMRDLKKRGVGSPMLFVTDGLQGMPEAIGRVFPMAQHQTCLVHVQRNLAKGVRKPERKRITDDFKAVYLQDDEKSAGEELQRFVQKWQKAYPTLMRRLLEKRDLLTFYKYPEALRKHIYTSNTIESFNAKLKRETRKKIQLNSLDNADVVIAQCCISYNHRQGLRRIYGYDNMTSEEKAALGFNI